MSKTRRDFFKIALGGSVGLLSSVYGKPVLSQVSPGAVLSGANAALGIAEQLRKWIDQDRGCAITLANQTPYQLDQPKRYTYSGSVTELPFPIRSNQTGCIIAKKSAGAARGSVGVLSYRLGNNSPYKLQVMWSVPYDYVFYENWVNVCIGQEEPSEQLYDDMYYGRKGEITKAKDTSKIFVLNSAGTLQADVFMSENGQALMSITLRGR